MPALKPTDFQAEVVWLGRVVDQKDDLRSEVLSDAVLTFAGLEGEWHSGLTRPACTRTLAQYPRFTEIRNVRQLTVLSQEDLDAIADATGVEAVDPALLGASMVLKGIPDFTHVPPSSRLQMPDGASLVVDMENRPCTYLSRDIAKDHSVLGHGFKPAAKNRRGVTAWVEREGRVQLGDRVTLHIPDQPVWSHLDIARR